MLRQESYSASKAGITALLRSVAVELAKYDIQANTILPGRIATDMTEGARGRGTSSTPRSCDARPPRDGEGPRISRPAGAYLASPATKFHAGDALGIDGAYAVF
jgi:NAD(P)-dependent dehydrogenase (short-subunit alcohol dehydrogenase family)